MNRQARTLVLAVGGTAGHVFPAKALGQEMLKRGWKVSFVTDERGEAHGGIEGVSTHCIRAGGVAGKRFTRLLRSIPELAVGTVQARSFLNRIKPDVVVGFGGYASVPTMLAATFGKHKTAIHEQNAILGRANRLLATRVGVIASSYASCQSIPKTTTARIVHTGMPVRAEVLSVSHAGYPKLSSSGSISLFIMGGSQGAQVFSQVVPAALARLNEDLRRRLQVVQQCREEDLPTVQQVYANAGIAAELSTFFNNVPDRLANAHLVIERAGASSVSETLVVGRPSILVPYPHAIDDHQSANAHAVANAGAGWVMDQTVFTTDALSRRLAALVDNPQVLEAAAECARRAGKSHAAASLGNLVEELASSNGNNDDFRPLNNEEKQKELA